MPSWLNLALEDFVERLQTAEDNYKPCANLIPDTFAELEIIPLSRTELELTKRYVGSHHENAKDHLVLRKHIRYELRTRLNFDQTEALILKKQHLIGVLAYHAHSEEQCELQLLYSKDINISATKPVLSVLNNEGLEFCGEIGQKSISIVVRAISQESELVRQFKRKLPLAAANAALRAWANGSPITTIAAGAQILLHPAE